MHFVCFWPLASLSAIQRYVWSWGTSRHFADIANMSLMTQLRRRCPDRHSPAPTINSARKLQCSKASLMTEARAERRLAAILAADVVGYSRLMGSDEEGTLGALKALRQSLLEPSIAEHRGRIVKTTGDGVLVEFASAVDAVRCAAEIQHRMAAENGDVAQPLRIDFRIGIHVGDIIIDDNDIFGDGVNIAARLEGIAEPGGVCISDDAQRQVRGKLDV